MSTKAGRLSPLGVGQGESKSCSSWQGHRSPEQARSWRGVAITWAWGSEGGSHQGFSGRDFTGHISSGLPVGWDQLPARQTQRDPRMESSLVLFWVTWGLGIRNWKVPVLKNYLEAQLIATSDNSSEGAPSADFVTFFCPLLFFFNHSRNHTGKP